MKIELNKGEDNCTNNRRKALGDVTNQLIKRRFVSISAGSCVKSGVGYSENKVEKEVGKKCSLVNEKERIKRVCVSPHPCSEINSLKGNVISGISKIPSENKELNLLDSTEGDGFTQCSFLAGDELRDAFQDGVSKVGSQSKNIVLLDLTKDDSVLEPIVQVIDDLRENSAQGVLKAVRQDEDEDPNTLEVNSCADVSDGVSSPGDESGDHCLPGVLALDSASEKERVDGGDNSDVGRGIHVSGNSQNDAYVCPDEGDWHGGEDFVMSQTGSVDHVRLPESQESRCFGLERCTTLKGDDCSNSRDDIDTIKACTCSFCTKAAYIWSDLHYQDLQGRIAAIKKSKKEASHLIERSCGSLGTEKHVLQNSSKGVSSLKSHLLAQWRSLFAQMENMFEREGSQLEASLLPLKDLREKCKADLVSL